MLEFKAHFKSVQSDLGGSLPGRLIFGIPGKDGGYYLVAAEQVDANTIRFTFTPSQSGMPKVDPVDIELPGATDERIEEAIKEYLQNNPAIGKPGEPGFSPIAKVAQTDDGAVITITDKDSTTEAVITNGKNGYTPKKGIDYDDGKSAYEYAKDGGYTGTEADFSAKLAEEYPDVPKWAMEDSKPSYSKSEVGLGNVDNVKQYSPSNPPPYPVVSVNGKTGKVQLVAADVGARPSNWIPTAADVGALPDTYVPPNQTAAQVGADPIGTAAATVSTHNTSTDSHGDLRLELKAINDRLTAFFDSDNQTLDELSEIVAYITSNKELIDSITTSKVSVADIINNLATNVANKPLSAAQGVALKGLIDAVSASLSDYQPKGDYALASAIPTKVSQLKNDKGYLTEHQDISGKLDADKLPEAIDTALAQAKASGEFDGEDGQRGNGLLPVTTAPASYTTAVGGITPKYRMAISTIKTQAGVTEVLLGDTVRYSYYHYPIDYLDAGYAYFTERVSIRGATGAAGKDAVLTMFISPDGNDSNDGLTASTPKKTVKACVTAGAKRISAKRGVYKENVLLTNIGELEILPTDNDLTYAVGVEREPIVFDTSDTVAVSSLAAYNSIKRVAYSNSANTQFDKVFTKKSQPPVVGDGYGSRYNSTIWLLSSDEKTVCIKLKPVLTVAECEAQANTFTYVSGYIYINANMTSVAKVIVPTNWDTGFYVSGADRLVLKEVEVRFSGTYNIDIHNCAYFDFYKCACKYTSYGSGFHPFNSNGKLTACYATKNYDGYGISGYGHTTYVDCVSEFNFDDGMSHHSGTSGTVIGGRYEGNGKGGNTPAYGAKVNIYGGLYKDNASFGIGYLWATDLDPASGMVQGAVMVGNPIGLSVSANCDVTAMNCTYKDNASDKDVKGNLTEYNANYVKTINGIQPDEKGDVEIDVSGGGGETSGYTNVLPLSINADGTPYVGDSGEKGYRTGYRVSSSGVEKSSDKNDCSGFIACKSGDVIRIKNGTPETSGYSVQYGFTESFAIISTAKVDMSTATAVNGIYSFTIPTSNTIAYIRLTLGNIDDTTIVTINEEITD